MRCAHLRFIAAILLLPLISAAAQKNFPGGAQPSQSAQSTGQAPSGNQPAASGASAGLTWPRDAWDQNQCEINLSEAHADIQTLLSAGRDHRIAEHRAFCVYAGRSNRRRQ
jgi:hypothetical protein